MKIAIGFKIKRGPWGGGNQFVKLLSNKLIENGHSVYYNLSRRDLDIILLTDPRKNSKFVSFGSGEIIKYLLTKNSNAIVVHRINECDQRKKTFYMNFLLRFSNYCSDHNVYIASWLKDLNLSEKNKPRSIILNGGDNKIFNIKNNKPWDNKGPLKIVTHHWGGNHMKGFDVYQKLDKLLKDKINRKKYRFTYIGNLPKNFYFSNTKYIKPLSGQKLAKELSKHHVYLTASINEPAGMHHIEGALSGLPLVFRKSGALPEYCSKYGIGFKDTNFLPALESIFINYFTHRNQLSTYPYNSEKMTSEYINLFEELYDNKLKILKKRNLFRNPLKLFFNILFL